MQLTFGATRLGILSRCTVAFLALATLALAEDIPVNGNFEKGNLTDGPWKAGPDHDGGIELISGAGTTTTLGAISGNYSGLVHTGVTGVDAATGVLESPTFTVTQWGGSLSFSWDFLTNENDSYDWELYGGGVDSFKIELISINGVYGDTPLVSGDVLTSDLGIFDAMYEPVSSPANSSYIWHTGASTYSMSFAEELGRESVSYWLRFTVLDGPLWEWDEATQEVILTDPNNKDFESALLVDDLSFIANQPPPPATPIPEPSTFALIALGGLAAFVARRRRR